jgi:hypothetical protein
LGRYEDFIASGVRVQENSPVTAIGGRRGSVEVEERFLDSSPRLD